MSLLNTRDKPKYVNYKELEFEHFLTQVGSITDEQKAVFIDLIELWRPEIEYSAAVALLSTKKSHVDYTIDQLFKKLKAAKIGLITYKYLGNEKSFDKIILTNPNDHYFYYYLIEEALKSCIQNPNTEYLTLKSLENYKIDLPKEMIIEIDKDQLLDSYFSDKHGMPKVIAVSGLLPSPIIIPSRSFNDFFKLVRLKILIAFNSALVVELIANELKMHMKDVRAKIEKKEKDFFIFAVNGIYKNIEALKEQTKLTIPNSFLQSIIIMATNLNNKDKYLEIRKDLESKNNKMLKSIKEYLINYPCIVKKNEIMDAVKAELSLHEKTVTIEQEDKFIKELEGHGERDRFIFPVNDAEYIISTGLYDYFRAEDAKIKEQLEPHYIEEIRKMILKGNKNITFLEVGYLREDLGNFIKKLNPYMDFLYKNPEYLYEAIEFSLKTKDLVNSQGVAKNFLQYYFNMERKEIFDLLAIYPLNMMRLYDKAFNKISFLTRLIFKFIGRYEEYKSHFLKMEQELNGLVAYNHAALRRSQMRQNGTDNTKDPSIKAGSSAKEPVKKDYTEEEKKSAWNSFNQEINEKKK